MTDVVSPPAPSVGRSVGLSPDTVARAIVAACMLLGVDPAKAFDKGPNGKKPGGYAARVLAAQGVKARLGARSSVLARVFAIPVPELSPSWAKKRGITTDQLLAIAEAIGDAPDADPHARFMAPLSGTPVRANPRKSPKPEARSPKPEARSPKPGSGRRGESGQASGGAVRGVVRGRELAADDSRPAVRRGCGSAERGDGMTSCAVSHHQLLKEGVPMHGGEGLVLGRDIELVRACLAQGGFPRAVVVEPGRTVWANHEGKPWTFGGPKARRPRKA